MNAQQIKDAIDNNKMVYWSNKAYRVIKDDAGQYLIWCMLNDYYIGLTHLDGVTLNGNEDDFFIE